eukprot:scaffold259471_cov35-Attheya_sp.AAC.1
MVRDLVYLAGCFHPTTNEFVGAPHPKMVDRQVRNWLDSRELYPEEEEKALSCMVAFVNRFDGSLVCIVSFPWFRRKEDSPWLRLGVVAVVG